MQKLREQPSFDWLHRGLHRAVTVALATGLLALAACSKPCNNDSHCDGSDTCSERGFCETGTPTTIVPSRFEGFRTCDVIAPPEALRMPELLTRYTNCNGIAIFATDGVDDEALRRADEMVDFLFGDTPALAAMIESSAYHILKGPGVDNVDLEFNPNAVPPENDVAVDGSQGVSASSAANLLCQPDSDGFYTRRAYFVEAITLHMLSAVPRESPLIADIRSAYNNARNNNLWTNTFAAENLELYFMSLTTEWFEIGTDPGPIVGDGFANHIVTRDALEDYDPQGYDLLADFYTNDFDVPGCFQHNALDPYQSPSITCLPTTFDDDDNQYNVVRIGDQCWMASNLKTTISGTIPEVTDRDAWVTNSGVPASAFYDNQISTGLEGLLYNFEAAQLSGICPAGMHVPSQAEMVQLRTLLDSVSLIPSAVKLRARNQWGEAPAENTFGFQALPVGIRFALPARDFDRQDSLLALWTSTSVADRADEAKTFAVDIDSDNFEERDSPKLEGLSIRCVGP